MKKLLWLLGILGLCLCVVLANLYQTVGRGQMRLTLSKELSLYLVENGYVFPKSWNDFEEYYFVKKFGKSSDSKWNSVLNKKFTVPWGESLTNNNVLTSVWFKSIDRQRVAEDEAFTREVLFNVLSISTNTTVNEIIKGSLR